LFFSGNLFIVYRQLKALVYAGAFFIMSITQKTQSRRQLGFKDKTITKLKTGNYAVSSLKISKTIFESLQNVAGDKFAL
jgi:hypothetical protein